MDSPSSFRAATHNLNLAVDKYYSFNGGNENELRNINNQVENELKNLSWIIDILDPSNAEHMAIFQEAQLILTKLNIPLILANLNTHNASKELENEIQHLKTIQSDAFSSVMEKTCSKITLWIEKEILDNKSLEINPEKANLSFSSFMQKSSFTPTSHPADSLIFAPGKYYNPIPAFVSRYVDEVIINNTERIKDLVDTLCGVRIDTSEDYIQNNEKKEITDQNNLTITAPVAFTKDYIRGMSVTLNGELFNDSTKTINSLVRMLYELCGHEGGSRLMLLCTQATSAHPFLYRLDCQETYAKYFPSNLMIQPMLKNAENIGLKFDIVVNKESDKVDFIFKYAYKLQIHDQVAPGEMGDPSEKYTGHVVYKLNMSMPYSVLIMKDIKDHRTEVEDSKIQIKEQFSTPIINNQAELMELLHKF